MGKGGREQFLRLFLYQWLIFISDAAGFEINMKIRFTDYKVLFVLLLQIVKKLLQNT